MVLALSVTTSMLTVTLCKVQFNRLVVLFILRILYAGCILSIINVYKIHVIRHFYQYVFYDIKKVFILKIQYLFLILFFLFLFFTF